MKKKGGILVLRADIDSTTINKTDKTFEVVFATETPVLRSPYWADETFYEVLVCDKKSMRTERLDAGLVPLLDTHNGGSVTTQYGITRSWNIKNKECRALIQYSTQASKADMWSDIENQVIRSISVGAVVHQYERIPDKDPKKIPVYRAVDWETLEISLAPIGKDVMSSIRAEITGDSQRSENNGQEHEIEILNYNSKRSIMTPEEIQAQHDAAVKAERERGTAIRSLVRAAKLDGEFADDLIERAVTVDAAKNEIAAKVAAPKALTADDVQRAVEAEQERSTEIRRAARNAKLGDEYADELIARKKDGKVLTLDAARAEIINKMAETDTNIAGGGAGIHMGRDLTHDAKTEDMINGLMHRAMPGSVTRYEAIEKDSKRKPFDVNRNEYKHMKLLDIAKQYLIARGVKGVDSMPPAEIAKRAIDSTDLPDLFTSTVKRFLRMWYEPVVPEWAGFSRAVTADDFRVKTGVKVSAAVTFEELAEDGEYKESNLMSDEKATLQLRTYARSFGITRKTIVNDDLGVIANLPRLIGIGARQFQSQKVWALITGNAICPDGNALFSAAHKNLGTGASAASVINDSSLSAGRTAMRRQLDPQGNQLLIVPKYLLVPPELQTTAEKQIRPISAVQTQDVNIWGDLVPFTNPYFADTKAWYMAADQGDTTVDGIVHAYLEGQEGLFTESYVDHKTDKVVIKARLDFDCAVWGWQGWYKNVGAAPSGD